MTDSRLARVGWACVRDCLAEREAAPLSATSFEDVVRVRQHRRGVGITLSLPLPDRRTRLLRLDGAPKHARTLARAATSRRAREERQQVDHQLPVADLFRTAKRLQSVGLRFDDPAELCGIRHYLV